MSQIFVIKEQIQDFYSKYSRVVDKVFQFLLALVTFMLISQNIGFMEPLTKIVVVLALTVICTFLPLTFTVMAAAVISLLHLYKLSLVVAAVVFVIYFIMFVMYFRFTPKKAIILLLTPIAFAFKVPYIIPIAFALIGTPINIVPVASGTMVYFVLNYIKSYAKTITSADADGIMGAITVFIRQIFSNKEMWITITAFTICILVVYTLRRQSIDHSWEIAIVAGAMVNIIVMVVGDIAMGVHISYGMLLLGSAVSILIAFVLQLFVFTVDYSRTEHLQYEDDEYYYYVKAVPKITITAPEKTVKHINERSERGRKQEREPAGDDDREEKRMMNRKKRPRKSEGGKMKETDEVLLAKSLQDELDIQKIVEDELKN